jgi:hypothetical protein
MSIYVAIKSNASLPHRELIDMVVAVKESRVLSQLENVSRTKIRGVLALLKHAQLFVTQGDEGEAVRLHLASGINAFKDLRDKHDLFINRCILQHHLFIPIALKGELVWQLEPEIKTFRLEELKGLEQALENFFINGTYHQFRSSVRAPSPPPLPQQQHASTSLYGNSNAPAGGGNNGNNNNNDQSNRGGFYTGNPSSSGNHNNNSNNNNFSNSGYKMNYNQQPLLHQQFGNKKSNMNQFGGGGGGGGWGHGNQPNANYGSNNNNNHNNSYSNIYGNSGNNSPYTAVGNPQQSHGSNHHMYGGSRQQQPQQQQRGQNYSGYQHHQQQQQQSIPPSYASQQQQGVQARSTVGGGGMVPISGYAKAQSPSTSFLNDSGNDYSMSSIPSSSSSSRIKNELGGVGGGGGSSTNSFLSVFSGYGNRSQNDFTQRPATSSTGNNTSSFDQRINHRMESGFGDNNNNSTSNHQFSAGFWNDSPALSFHNSTTASRGSSAVMSPGGLAISPPGNSSSSGNPLLDMFSPPVLPLSMDDDDEDESGFLSAMKKNHHNNNSQTSSSSRVINHDTNNTTTTTTTNAKVSLATVDDLIDAPPLSDHHHQLTAELDKLELTSNLPKKDST